MNRRLWCFLGACLVVGCSDTDGAPPTRTYRMGFSAIPPRNDLTVALASLNLWATRADAGIMHLSIPWTVLLGGTAAETEVRTVQLPLAQFYRGHGFALMVTLDPTDGLNRAQEDPALIAAGRSIADTAIQRLYRTYVTAIDTILHPDYLGLAAETNLIRAAAPDAVYAAVVTMTNDAAAEQRGLGTTSRLYVSVQVEVAWGRLAGAGPYVGIAQDRADFPFIDAIGLSSYPYLAGFADPADLPDDYYSRLVEPPQLAVMVVEGGWPSMSAGTFVTSPSKQAQYLHRQGQLLDRAAAIGVFQLTFTDIDLVASPPPPGSILPLFATLGLVDTALIPKPSLASWDSLFDRRLRP